MSSEEPAQQGPHFAFKQSMFGAPSEFHLAPDAIEWLITGRSGRVPYGDVRRVRMAFRPMTMQNYRFIAEIWSARGPKLTIASTSWHGMIQQERLDAPYSAFMTELHKRIAAAGTPVIFQTGSPPLLYWIGLIIFVGICLALAALSVRGLQVDSWAGAAFTAAMLALFLWQTGGFFRRNRPGVYRPDAIPRHVLP